MFSKAISDLVRGTRMMDVWLYQAYHEMTAKYKRTFFGSFWIAGSMIATSLSLAIVFGGLFGQTLKEALPFIMSGILVFTTCGFIVNEAQELFVGNGGIIKNNAFPFTYYVFEGLAKSYLTLLHNAVVYYVAMALIGALVMPDWIVIVGLAVNFAIIFCWSTLIGMMSARFRDMRFMMPYIGQLLFFMTPIFWKASSLSGPRQMVATFNPFYGMLEIIRSPLMGQPIPTICWINSLTFLVVGIIAWLIFFPIYRKKIPFWV